MDLNTFINDLYDSGDLFLEERAFLREVQAAMLDCAEWMGCADDFCDHADCGATRSAKLRTLAGKNA